MKKVITFLLLAVILVGVAGLSTYDSYAGTLGYVDGHYLQQVSSADRSGIYTAQVVLNDPNSYLNVRSQPSMEGQVIGKLYHGDYVTVYVDRTVPAPWNKITY